MFSASSKIIWLCGLLLWACTYTYAQEGTAQNPFELKERIEEVEKQPATRNPQPATHNPKPATHNPQPATRNPQPETHNPKPATRNPQPATHNPQPATHNPQPATHNPQPATHNPQPTNPFEINNEPKEQEIPTTHNPQSETQQPTTRNSNNPQPGKLSHIWMGGIILILSILMAILNTLHQQELQKTLRAFSNPNMMNLIYRSQKAYMTTMYLLTYVLYVASAGLFLYLLGRYFEYSAIQSNIISVLVCMGFVAGVTFGKHLLLQIIGWIMPFSKELKLYNYMISVFNHIIGIVLLPFIIVAVFAPHPVGQWTLLAGLGLVLLIYLYRAFRGLIIGGGFISFHKFHFFLYLCAVEVAPLLILIKFLKFWG